jgi:adenylate cyclase
MLADAYIALGLKAESEAAARRSLRRISDAFGPEPEVAEVLAMGAVTLVMIGEYGRAEAWVRRALLLDPESYSVRYNAACTYAVIGRPDLAVQSLDHAFRHMPRARGWIYHSALQDPQLRSLQGRADFQDLLEHLAADARTDSLRQDVPSAAGVSGD